MSVDRELHVATSIRGLPSWLLGRAAARGRALVAEHLARHDIKLWEHAVLSALSDLGEISQAELGRAIALDRKDVAGVVSGLEGRGLLTRAPDPRDRRAVIITITADGKRLARQCARAGADANEQLLADLTPDERARLVDLVTRVARVDGEPTASST
ncbi:MAG TPA: MarR family transcriptional regulator [Stackebrandtia sp.]|jgi:DNA-binding MarR family transcriptional regulator|uniref:MarR family winged helix-turn-helix transcriptional regulator n=1 Tax=Stackebrandtia sp. TaxID=2023065 RepID=UPI002D6E89FD|nr:MarR family transcriptional regulator [Stackebrandtia sp.]HZE39977.1 MarR family transcriptional regulator [Stackebrandtia sp.]